MDAGELREFVAGPEDAGKRLDRFLTEKIADASRARVQELIAKGRVRVNGEAARSAHRLRGGETAAVEWEPPRPLRAYPEDIPLDIVYEDADIVVVNKPAGMSVHAGAGRDSGTLVNALLHRFGKLPAPSGDGSSEAGETDEPEDHTQLRQLRPGIVHRLDRQTSGLLVVARQEGAHRALAEQFQRREVAKTYIALVHGRVAAERGRINAPIARDLVRRHRMTSRRRTGREALTEYRVTRRFGGHTLLEVTIQTGRTHQIRVHLSGIGHAVVGDTLYGAPGGVLERNFLHAAHLGFKHPASGAPVEFAAPLPADLEAFLKRLTPPVGL